MNSVHIQIGDTFHFCNNTKLPLKNPPAPRPHFSWQMMVSVKYYFTTDGQALDVMTNHFKAGNDVVAAHEEAKQGLMFVAWQKSWVSAVFGNAGSGCPRVSNFFTGTVPPLLRAGWCVDTHCLNSAVKMQLWGFIYFRLSWHVRGWTTPVLEISNPSSLAGCL